MEINLLDRMLETFQSGRSVVTITLQNKVRVSGRIKAFDGYVIIVENSKQEIVSRHAVSCLQPVLPQAQPRPAAPAARPAPAKPAPVQTAKPAPSKPRAAQPQPASPAMERHSRFPTPYT